MAKLSEDDVADVRLAIGGDAAAYGRLYERHHKYIENVCNRWCRDRSLAEDLSQNVWLRAGAKLARLEKPEAFLGWMYSSTVNELKMWQRGEGAKPYMLSLDECCYDKHDESSANSDTLADTLPTDDLSLAGLPDRLALEQALEMLLSNAQRSVFVLQYIMGLDLTVVVRLTGWPYEKVKALSFRARRQVRGMLGRGE